MKILEIDYDYHYYPQGISRIEDFIQDANEHYNTFIELTRLEMDNCLFPYFVGEESKQVFINIATINKISEVEATILCRSDYDTRLAQVVQEKCVNCIHYEEDACEGEDHLKMYRDKISLNGECFGYEKNV